MTLLLPIVTGIIWGTTAPLFKSIMKNDFPYTSYVFVLSLIGAIIALPVFILNFNLPSGSAWIWLILTCVLLLSGNLLYTLAFQLENVSNISIVEKIEIIIPFIAGIVLFGEPLTMIKIFSALCIIAGISIIFLEKRKLKNSKGLLFAFFGGIILGLSVITENKTLKTVDPYTLQFFPYIFNCLILVFIPKTFTQAKKIFTQKPVLIILAELISVISYILILFSIKISGLTVGYLAIDPVYTIISVSIGIIFLREREKLLNKFLGVTLIVLGLFGLG